MRMAAVDAESASESELHEVCCDDEEESEEEAESGEDERERDEDGDGFGTRTEGREW